MLLRNVSLTSEFPLFKDYLYNGRDNREQYIAVKHRHKFISATTVGGRITVRHPMCRNSVRQPVCLTLSVTPVCRNSLSVSYNSVHHSVCRNYRMP